MWPCRGPTLEEVREVTVALGNDGQVELDDGSFFHITPQQWDDLVAMGAVSGLCAENTAARALVLRSVGRVGVYSTSGACISLPSAREKAAQEARDDVVGVVPDAGTPGDDKVYAWWNRTQDEVVAHY